MTLIYVPLYRADRFYYSQSTGEQIDLMGQRVEVDGPLGDYLSVDFPELGIIDWLAAFEEIFVLNGV